MAWSPDGHRLASACSDKTIRVWNWATREELLKLKGHSAIVSSVAWSPDGTCLASTSWDKTLRIWDSASGQELKCLNGHTDSVLLAGWSPDGSRVASVSKDGTAKIWDVTTGQEIHTLRGHETPVFSVAWSPDGRRLATQALTGQCRLRTWDASSGQQILGVRQTRVGSDAFGSVAWSPDGEQLATDGPSASIQFWDANCGKEVSFVLGHKQSPTVAWHPSGSCIASGARDGTVRVWPRDSQYEVLTLPGNGAPVWSPDGRRLASPALGGKIKIWDASRGYEIAGRLEEYETDRGYRLIQANEFDEAILAFAKLTKTSPGEFDYRTALAWAYFDRGTVAHMQGKVDEALGDFDEAIRLHPEYLQALNLRARVYLDMGAFAEAVPGLSKKFAIEYGTQKAITGHWLGLSYLATGDTEGYRSTCARMLQCFANAKDPEEGRWLAWTCALAPGATSDLSAMVSSAERAVQSGAGSVDCLIASGAILYRAGRFEEAIKRLTEASGLSQDPDSSSTLTARERWIGSRLPQQPDSTPKPSHLHTCYFQAMANHRLGREEEARKWFQEAIAGTECLLSEHEKGTVTLTWDQQLTLRLFQEEAEALPLQPD